MSVTLQNFIDYHVPIQTVSQPIHFFVFNDEPLATERAKIQALSRFIARIPSNHLVAIAPILLTKARPSGGHGGGTTPDVSRLRGRSEQVRGMLAQAQGVSYEVMEEVVNRFGRLGSRAIHYVALADWRQGGHATTVIHECTHAIDIRFSLTPRARADDPLRQGSVFELSAFPESLPRQACGHGHGDNINRRAVNAYVSMITGFPGVSPTQRQQIIAAFRDCQAFSGVPESWWNLILHG